jgi:hypothetical protein
MLVVRVRVQMIIGWNFVRGSLARDAQTQHANCTAV